MTPVYQTPVQYPVSTSSRSRCTFPPQQYDYCPNLPGIQTVLPAGYYVQNGYCYQQTYQQTYQQPYVALLADPVHRIRPPGATGNAIYWGALLSFALASAYYVLYYLPVATALAGRQRWLRARFDRVGSRIPFLELGEHGEYVRLSRPPPSSQRLPARKPRRLPDLRYHEAEFSRFIGAMPKDKMSFAKVEEGQAPRSIITRN